MRRARIATLGVPLDDALPAWVGAMVVLALHAATCSRSLSAFDSAELALAAYQGGLAHPPGHALHTLLGWIVTRGPGEPLFVLSLLSSVPAALAAFPVLSIAEAMTRRTRAREARWMGAIVFVCLSMHAAVWEPATRVEVYTLAGLLCLFAFSWIAEIRARAEGGSDTDGASAAATAQAAMGWRAPAVAGAALGLATGANVALAIVSMIGCAAALAPIARTIGVRRLASCAGAVVLGALVNVYVVLAPIDSRAFTWGKPRSVDALVDFLRGADYRHNAGVTADGLIDHLAALWTDQASRGLLLVIVVGIAGHVVLGRRGLGRIAAPLVTLAAWIGVAANRIFVIGIPDYDGYAWTPAMLACAGVVGVARLADAGRPRTRLLGMAAAALVAVPTSLARPAPWARTRAADRALHDVSTMLLRDAPRRALLMVAADHVAAPLLWVHEAEGVRPDVVVLPVGLASSSWYWDHLMARHPDLRPFALVGPGARRGRIERMLRENPGLVPVTDQAASVVELGWDECTQDVGAVARLAPCDGARLGTIATATRDARRLARWADELGDGSPSTDEAIGQVAYARGVRAWRGGEQRIAFALFAVALRAQERRAFDGVRGEVTRAPRILASPAIPRTRPIFDHAASRAAMCAMTEMAGARAPSFCGE